MELTKKQIDKVKSLYSCSIKTWKSVVNSPSGVCQDQILCTLFVKFNIWRQQFWTKNISLRFARAHSI